MVRIQRPQLATLDPMLRLPRVADRRAGFKNEHIPIPLDAGILGRTVEAAVRPATRNNSADDTNLVCLRTRTALELPGDCDGRRTALSARRGHLSARSFAGPTNSSERQEPMVPNQPVASVRRNPAASVPEARWWRESTELPLPYSASVVEGAPHAWLAAVLTIASRSAARASVRVDSMTGRDESLSEMSSGISVHPRTTASHPRIRSFSITV